MERGHKSGKRIMAGGYPVKTAKEFLRLLKQLGANGTAKGKDIEKALVYGRADMASKPFKRDGKKAKRAHVTLELVSKELKK